MFMRGVIDLVGRPLCEKLKWLKNLSIYEGMLKSFNSSMVIVLDGAHVLYLIWHGKSYKLWQYVLGTRGCVTW